MNSDVICADLASGVQRRVRVVYPQHAYAARGWVSVPRASAALSVVLRGDVVEAAGREVRLARFMLDAVDRDRSGTPSPSTNSCSVAEAYGVKAIGQSV